MYYIYLFKNREFSKVLFLVKSNIEQAIPHRTYYMPHIFLLIQIPFGQIRGPQDRPHSRLEFKARVYNSC